MSVTYKVLGQSNPAALTTTTLYTVVTGTSVVVSTLVICNQTNATATFRVAIKPTANILDASHYISYDSALPASDSVSMTLGITMGSDENVIVYSSNSATSFNLFGTEII